MSNQTTTSGAPSATTATRKTDDRVKSEGSRVAGQVIGAGLRPVPARERYLLGTRLGASVDDADFDRLVARLAPIPDVRTLREIKTRVQPGAVADSGALGSTRTLVLDLAADTVDHLTELIERDPALRGVVLEYDAPLIYGGGVRLGASTGVPGPTAEPVAAEFTVVGKNDEPIEGAFCSMIGSFGTRHGVTNAQGRVDLTVFADAPRTLETLSVRPRADYWSYWISRPALDLTRDTRIRLAPLDQAFPQFPKQPLIGWGVRAMRLDLLPRERYDGHGVRVALVSSGCGNRHRNLRHVRNGSELASSGSSAWTDDESGYGTHCAGIIVGDDADGGTRGVAPKAELFVVKVDPSARVSDLIDAIDRSIEHDADIICFTLGTQHRSALLQRKVAEAKARGIACIAGAGDSNGSIQSPAAAPEVLAVAAIGWRAAFPSDSQHAQSVGPAGSTQDGYFVASFSPAGPEIDVCGPGVAIVSSIPPDNFAACDGTATAAAHVAGLAALVLAHHPDFNSNNSHVPRGTQRPDRLFEILKASALPFRIGDAFHTGFGLPDGPRALNHAAPLSEGSRTPDREMVRTLQDLANAAHRSAGRPADIVELNAAVRRAGLPGAPVWGGAALAETPPTEQPLQEVLRRAGLESIAESESASAREPGHVGVEGGSRTATAATAALRPMLDAVERAGLGRRPA